MCYVFSRSARKSCPSMYETLEAIKAAPSAYKDPEQLVEEVKLEEA